MDDVVAQVVDKAFPATSPVFRYDVFLSFRGSDTCKFIDYLSRALEESGISVFRDGELGTEDEIGSLYLKAIQESQLSIVVISKGYAYSTRCLDELVKIMECNEINGQRVIPVFYDLDRSDVEYLRGSFQEAFDIHEFKEKVDKVKRWRTALLRISELSGWVNNHRKEYELIEEIVEFVDRHLSITSRKTLHVPSDLVGIEKPIIEIYSWLKDDSAVAGIAAIHGIGGIGKTTIADHLFRSHHWRFKSSCFLPNVREISLQPNGLIELQRKFLSNILGKEKGLPYNIDGGILKIKKIIETRKVLIVLDDVQCDEQLKAIIGDQNWLFPGSKVIITTRYRNVPQSFKPCKKFTVPALDDYESLQLFSQHAFRKFSPTNDCKEQIMSVVNHCHGLPLALKVWGCYLFDRPMNIWEIMLQKPESIDHQIFKILRISYDSLDDNHDKSLFLDIACFFVGKDMDYASYILEGCDYNSKVGIQNLIDGHLVTVSAENKLMMNQWVRGMGRELVSEESPFDPGKRSRLWHYNDALTVLKKNTGTETIRGLILNKQVKTASENGVEFNTKAFVKISNLELLHLNNVKLKGGYNGFPKYLVWLCWHGSSLNCIPNIVSLEDLVVLDMRYSSLRQCWKGTRVLEKLKIIDLSHSCHLVTTPNFKGLPCLERLKLKGCINLVEIDESIGYLNRLVLLNLKGCKSLKKLPEKIGMISSLSILDVSGCWKLDELPKELGKLEQLTVLDNRTYHLMQGGIGLTELPMVEEWEWSKGIFWMDNELSSLPTDMFCPVLHTLFLQRNYKLRMIPNLFFDSMPSLQVLNLSRTGIRYLPESLFRLVKLKRLFLNHCDYLLSLPPQIGELENLEVLDLEGTELVDLPKEIEKLVHLTCLEVTFCEPINNDSSKQSGAMIPLEVISALSKLEELNIDVNPDDGRWNECAESVVSAICGSTTLTSLKAYFPLVHVLSHFKSNSKNILSSLSHFRLKVGRHGKRILSRIPRCVEFELEKYDRCLRYINGKGNSISDEVIEVLRHATGFFLDRHATVRTLSEFGHENIMQLKCCVAGECNELQAIIDGDRLATNEHGCAISGLAELEYLYIYYMKNLRSIWKGPLHNSGLFSLKSLTLCMCAQLTTIFTPGLAETLLMLEELTVDGCPKITSLECHEDKGSVLPALKKISLRFLPELGSIFTPRLLASLPSLEELSVDGCPKIKSLASCNELDSIFPLGLFEDPSRPEDFVSKGIARADGCELSEDSITCVFPALKKISLHYLPELVSICNDLPMSPKLEWMSFYFCPKLKSLPISKDFNQNLKKIKGELSWWKELKWKIIKQGSWVANFVQVS